MIRSKEPLDEKALRNPIDATDCRAGEMHCKPYEKRECSRS